MKASFRVLSVSLFMVALGVAAGCGSSTTPTKADSMKKDDGMMKDSMKKDEMMKKDDGMKKGS